MSVNFKNIRPSNIKISNVVSDVDDLWNSVVLLVSGEDQLGSTTFTDLSLSGNNLTATTGTSISQTEYRFGSKSIYNDGQDDSGAYSNLSSDFIFGSSDFTVETWYYPVSKLNSYPRIMQFGDTSWNNNNCWAILDRHDTSPTKFAFASVKLGGNDLLLESVTDVQDGQWYHIALSREGSTFRLFINGVLEDTYTNSIAIDEASTNRFNLGMAYFTEFVDDQANGYFDEIRVTKGVSRYTSSFTIPTSQFPRR